MTVRVKPIVDVPKGALIVLAELVEQHKSRDTIHEAWEEGNFFHPVMTATLEMVATARGYKLDEKMWPFIHHGVN